MDEPQKPSKKTKIFHWAILGIAIFIIALAVGVSLVIWKFSPVVTLNEETGRIALLGGMLELRGEDGTLRIGDPANLENTLTLDGTLPVDSKVKKIEVKFSDGKIEIKSTNGKTVSWNCNYHGDAINDYVSQKKNIITLHFEVADGVQCKIGVPKKIPVLVAGTNGVIEIRKSNNPINAELENGKIEFEADKLLSYSFEIAVKNGANDEFESSKDPKAIPVSLKVNNGKIEKVD